MKFLSIDSSRNIQSVSLFDSASKQYLIQESSQSKSSVFVSDLLKLLSEQSIKPEDISLLLVTVGPGSFTGIRTGISVIKTLAAELGLDIFTANNFELLRYEQNLTGPLAINAGLNDYYVSLDQDYENPETNFFSLELNGTPLLDFKTNNISGLLIEYFQSQKTPNLIKYTALEPYYLREPSVGNKVQG